MLGALIVTSATMTSCKDYDDDINANTSKIADLQTQIDKLNTDLTNCKTSCQTDIAKAQSTADAATALANAAQAAADKAQAAADANAAQLAEQLKMINGKVDQKEFSDSISSLISQILGINETLLTLADKDKALENSIIANQAAIADIQGQIATLNEFMTAIKSLDLVNKFPALQQDVADLKTKTDQTIKDLNDVKSDLQKKYDELKQSISDTNVKVDANTGQITINTQAIADNKAAIDQLKKDMEKANNAIEALDKDLNAKITALTARVDKNEQDIAANVVSINTLNVYVDKTITSLVYDPEEWVFGLGAIPVYSVRNLNDITVKKPATLSTYGENYTTATKTFNVSPQGVAKYYLNPSTADISKYTFNFVDLETTNQTRGHNDTTSVTPVVKSTSAEGGILTVLFNFNSDNVNDAITNSYNEEDMTESAWVSTLALQATRKNLENENSTVTSDFAVLKPTYMQNLVLANNEYSAEEHVANVKKYHLVTTAADAINAYKAKNDSVAFQLAYSDEKGIDLDQKIEIHYTSSRSSEGVGNTEKIMSVAKARELGFDVTYTLVPYTLTAGGTVDETAASKIKLDGGHIALVDGQAKSAIGHMAVVRVELKSGSKTAVIGYVSILVTPSGLYQISETYDEGLYLNCGYDSAKLVTMADVETKIMEETQISKEVYEANYTLGTGRYTDNKGTVEENPFGTVTAQTGTNAQLVWRFSNREILAKFYKDGKFVAPTEDIVTWVCMKSKNPLLYPDVWIKLIIPKDKIYHAQATISLAEEGIKQSWYADGSIDAGSGFAEVHSNVVQPGQAANDKTFESNLLATFVGNKVLAKITNSDKFAGLGTDLTIYFDVAKYNAELEAKKEWVGASGKKYYMKATNETVYAYPVDGVATDMKPVVVLTGDGNTSSPAYRAVIFQNNDVAKDLLNVVSHKNADGKTTSAFMTYMVIVDKDNCLPLDLTGDTHFNVRYLRPIDVSSSMDSPFEDADEKGYSQLNIADLFKFNDWRDISFGQGVHEDWFMFYGIKALNVNKAGIRTDLNGKDQLLSEVTSLIDLTVNTPADQTYTDWDSFVTAMGTITYRNNGLTVGDFNLYIPFTIVHNWGNIENVMITVPVHHTKSNSK